MFSFDDSVYFGRGWVFSDIAVEASVGVLRGGS